MEIEKSKFERAIVLAYKRGCVRNPDTCSTPKEVKGVIIDLYDLLHIDDPQLYIKHE